MSLWDLARAAGRYWHVVLVGLVCTMLAGLFVLDHGGVYFSRSEVYFLAPVSERYPNTLITQSEDLIITAGVVAEILNGTEPPVKMGSPEVSIVGRGVRDGYSIALPDSGGQWAPNFNRQVLDVQTVGESADAVVATQRQVSDQILEELDRLQDRAGVEPVNKIAAYVQPSVPQVRYMDGDRKRALAMTGVLGTSLTLAAVAIADRRSRRRRS